MLEKGWKKLERKNNKIKENFKRLKGQTKEIKKNSNNLLENVQEKIRDLKDSTIKEIDDIRAVAVNNANQN